MDTIIILIVVALILAALLTMSPVFFIPIPFIIIADFVRFLRSNNGRF